MALLPSKIRHFPPFLIDDSLVFPEFFPSSHKSVADYREKWWEVDGFWSAVAPLTSWREITRLRPGLRLGALTGFARAAGLWQRPDSRGDLLVSAIGGHAH